MNSKQKFENFLESLKKNGNKALIESVKKGYKVCFESYEFNDEQVDDWDKYHVTVGMLNGKPEYVFKNKDIGQKYKRDINPDVELIVRPFFDESNLPHIPDESDMAEAERDYIN